MFPLSKTTVAGLMLFMLPLLALLAATWLISATRADILVCQAFHDTAANQWEGDGAFPCSLLYRYGEWPGVGLGIISLAGLLIGLLHKPRNDWQRPCLFLLAVLLVGPGFLINGLLKEYWGRPRPREIIEFGGQYEFAPAFVIGPADSNSAFPCGHASMGFYLFAPAFVFWQQRRSLAVAFGLLGISFGIVVGVGRVLQGSHFPSDILWSAGIVYLTALGLFYALRPDLAFQGAGAAEVQTVPQLRLYVPPDEAEADEDAGFILPFPGRSQVRGAAQRRAKQAA